MVAELNIPRHSYYQRQNNRRLARQSESRTWLDAGGAPLPDPGGIAVPAGFMFGMKLGSGNNGGGTITGMQLEARTNQASFWGDLNPSYFRDLLVASIASTSAGVAFVQLGPNGQLQLSGVASLALTMQGYGTTMTLPWSGANLRYELAGQSAFLTYMSTRIGQVFGVNLVAP